jgi:hypothetical protein
MRMKVERNSSQASGNQVPPRAKNPRLDVIDLVSSDEEEKTIKKELVPTNATRIATTIASPVATPAATPPSNSFGYSAPRVTNFSVEDPLLVGQYSDINKRALLAKEKLHRFSQFQHSHNQANHQELQMAIMECRDLNEQRNQTLLP